MIDADFQNFALGALFNLAVVVVIVRFIYYPLTRSRSYVLTFLAFNPTIYFVMGLLTSIELSIGVGFGLFAIFSVLRYRTEEMPIREMTYLFIIIALPVMNSVLSSSGELDKILFANVVIVLLLYILEREWGFRFETSKRITYDKIELISPQNNQLLVEDLRKRTGLDVRRVEVGFIDLLRDTADLRVYYQPPRRDKGRAEGLDAEYQPIRRTLEDR